MMVRLALWREMLRRPGREEAGHKLRVSLSHLSSWGFVVGKSKGDLTTGPGVVGGFATSLAGFFSTSANVPCLRYTPEYKTNPRILEYNKK